MAFHLTTPALYLVVLAGSDLTILLSGYTLATGLGMLICAGLATAVLLATGAIRGARETVLLASSTIYANTGNIGIPLALAALGTVAHLAPVMLIQILVLSPIALLVLDLASGRTGSFGRMLLRPFVNPIILTSILGLTLALTGTPILPLVLAPLEVLGQASIPLLLLLFGMSLRGARPLRREAPFRAAVLIAVLAKTFALPVATVLLGALVFGVTGADLLGLALAASLPSAQTVYSFAVQYRIVEEPVRDVILISTALSLPLVLSLPLLLP